MSVSAPAVLLLGEPGNGKTYSCATLANRVEKFFYLFTDPGGDESLVDALQALEVPIDKIHWHYVPPVSEGWDTLEALATQVNRLDYERLAGIKAGINKQDHRQMYEIINVLSDFKCQRTGESFGPADKWPNTYGIVFDSLTGLNKIAKDTTVGAKPTLHQGEWGVAMAMEEMFIRKFTADIKCPRVMIGHLDMTKDEVSGRMLAQVALLGNKLAPNIPSLFSDVVYAYRDGTKFLWSTAESRMSLKARNLPISDKIDPSFEQILDKWEDRKAYASASGITPPSAEDAKDE